VRFFVAASFGICGAIALFDTYLKLEKWQLILSLLYGTLVASVYYSCSNFT
jgi:hypothetical protein